MGVCVDRHQMGDYTGEVLSQVTVPLPEKPLYTAPIILTNGNRHKADMKTKVRACAKLHYRFMTLYYVTFTFHVLHFYETDIEIVHVDNQGPEVHSSNRNSACNAKGQHYRN